MDAENEITEQKSKNRFVPICITQAICIAVILIAVLIIKFFFNDSFQKIQKWYGENILDETSVSEIFDKDCNNEI